RVSLPLPAATHAETVFKTDNQAEVCEGRLHVQAKWRTQEVSVRMSCPSRILHADKIREKQRWLEERSPEEKAKLHDVLSSWSAQPVLFISHRWESQEHPDPHGRQLAKLSGFRNCLLIYDYTSFPQDPASTGLQLILQNMTRLIRNVVVLGSPE